MSNLDLTLLKQLREESGAGVVNCRKALEEVGNDLQEARRLLREWGVASVARRSERETGAGYIDSYIHADGTVGVLLELDCETDFVANSDVFRRLAHELAMQVAAGDPQDTEGLEAQDYIRDGSRKVADVVAEAASKVGENLVIKRFTRFAVGEEL